MNMKQHFQYPINSVPNQLQQWEHVIKTCHDHLDVPGWNVHDVLVEKHSSQDISKTLICPEISPLKMTLDPSRFNTVILVVLHTLTNCWGYADSNFLVGVCSSWGNIIPILWLNMFNPFETTRIPIAIGYDLV